MGVTHYWTRATELPKATFAAAVQDASAVLSRTDVALAGFEGHGQPILQPDAIVFNGAARASCEPFEVRQVEFDRRGRPLKSSYCKTELRPYDLLVKVTLIVLKHHLGDELQVASDQDDDAWEDARRLVVNTLGFGDEFRLNRKE
ncbi:hypothetical protein BH09PLA1_BH09PLA1_01360 [soil metagenome]